MSQIVERVSDEVRAVVLARFDHKPPTTDAVVNAHQEARGRCKDLAGWAMDTLPPSDFLDSALGVIFATCTALNTAIAQTQLTGDVQRTLDKLKAERVTKDGPPAELQRTVDKLNAERASAGDNKRPDELPGEQAP